MLLPNGKTLATLVCVGNNRELELQSKTVTKIIVHRMRRFRLKMYRKLFNNNSNNNTKI